MPLAIVFGQYPEHGRKAQSDSFSHASKQLASVTTK